MEEDGHGKRVSSSAVSSRLSAKAQPFRLNRFTAQPTWTSSLTSVDPCDSLIKSLSNVNLEEDPLPSASNFGLDSLQGSWFGQHSDSDSLACTNYAYETLLEQGKPVKKSKLYDENSESVHEKCSYLTMGRETPFTSSSTDPVDAGIFSSSAVNSVATSYEFPMSVIYSASMLQSYSQPELTYTAVAASWNRSNSTMTFGEVGLTKYDPCAANSTASQSPRYDAFPDLGLGSSDTRITLSPMNPILSKNAEVTGSFAVKCNDNSSKYSPPDIMDLHQLLYGEGKKTDHDKSLSDKGNERKCGKPVSSEGSDPLLTDKSDPQITLEKFYDKSSSEHQDAEAAVSLSTKLDGNDSDVDSPCWRGSLASRQTPLGVSRSLSSHSIENVQEASYSLNPLAPHFFPRPSKAIVNCYANEYDADDFSSFKKSESGAVGAVSSFSKENTSVDKAGSKLSLSLNGMGTQTSNDIHEPKREYALLEKSGSYSALSEGISKLLSTDSKIDVSTVLNMMHDLSSFLVQNCSNDVLLNDHDLIQHIINNLCMCFQHRAGGKTPMPDFTVSGTPYFPNKSTEIIEAGCSNMGFQVTKTGALAVPHELDHQNVVGCLDITERMLNSFPSYSNIVTGKSKDIIQVMGNAVRDSYSTKDEIDPQASVYKKLWLEAEATLRAMKYERCVMHEIGNGMAQSKQK
ncbi:uncharacterized protein LOC133745828 isoform X2 [Rosa rugosa]|uniref:uncharacterized protein LOC133745828 isoform X2 n=1 Tax=Rosa rugosa TaxID=74645 RepID=UPI002B40B084|nr:uncharacterized protein LOC133745828 isoform X2 [Rosa rugosa]